MAATSLAGSAMAHMSRKGLLRQVTRTVLVIVTAAAIAASLADAADAANTTTSPASNSPQDASNATLAIITANATTADATSPLLKDGGEALNSTNYNGTNVEGSQSLNLDSFMMQQLVSNNVAVAAVTLYSWTFIETLGAELSLYCRKGVCTQSVLFALVRYGVLPALVLPAYSTWHDFSKDPSGCIEHQLLVIVPVQLIVGVVLAWRARAIWNKDWRVTACLSILVAAQAAISFALLWFVPEKLLPNGACMPVPPLNRANTLPWFYFTAFLFDLTLIILTTTKLLSYARLGRPSSPSGMASLRSPIAAWRHMRADLTPLIARMLKSGLLYFATATTFNFINFVLETRRDIHSKALIVLYAPLMCITCQRIILLDSSAMGGNRSGARSISGSRPILSPAHGGGGGGAAHVGEGSLVDRMMREKEGRQSWEGDDLPAPALHSSSDEKMPGSSRSGSSVSARAAHAAALAHDRQGAATMPHLVLDMAVSGASPTSTAAQATPKSSPEDSGLSLGASGSTLARSTLTRSTSNGGVRTLQAKDRGEEAVGFESMLAFSPEGLTTPPIRKSRPTLGRRTVSSGSTKAKAAQASSSQPPSSPSADGAGKSYGAGAGSLPTLSEEQRALAIRMAGL